MWQKTPNPHIWDAEIRMFCFLNNLLVEALLVWYCALRSRPWRLSENIIYVKNHKCIVRNWCFRPACCTTFSLAYISLIINVVLVSSYSYLTYIKLCTLVKRNESMAHTLQAKLKEPEADESKRGPRPQDLIRLYDIILQVSVWTLNVLWSFCVCDVVWSVCHTVAVRCDESMYDLCCQQWREGNLTLFDRLCHLLLTA